MINAIPIFGWLLDLIFKISLAVPFWIIWTGCGIGERFFWFLPQEYKTPRFWECVGLFIVVPIIYWIFVPKLVSVTLTNNNEKK